VALFRDFFKIKYYVDFSIKKELMNIIEGIILAGGKGSRVKTNKLLLYYESHPLIYHVVKSMSTVCDKITIVTGFYQENYLAYLEEFSTVYIVHNEDYEQGMFSSVLAGIKNIHHDCFIIPGDYPLVNEQTYQELLAAKGEIRVPSYHQKGGHPIYLEKHIVMDLKKQDKSSNLKAFRNQHHVTYVNVNDPNILFDVDYMEDYHKLIQGKGVSQ
jgi:molybdenum cofactor cytidylyltransferase